ncbi:hypothetical protein [Nostoc sp.]|uniref:hypothetical protein n=1 Tax=Nostoc sp. TaxID=1180 RepID=UPI002FFAA30F
MQKQGRKSIFSSNIQEYSRKEEMRISYSKREFLYIQSLQDLHLFFLKNEKLKDFLKSSISLETLKFIEYDETPSLDRTAKIFNYLLNKKEFKSIKNSILANLVESINKGNTQDITLLLENYRGSNISNQQSKSPDTTDIFGIQKAEDIAYDIYQNFYSNDFIIVISLINYLILDLVVLLLFLFKNTYWLDFILAIIYLFILIVVLTFTASLSSVNDLSLIKKIMIFVFLPTLFSYFQTLNFIKPNKYSRFKTLNIIIFPFALIIVAYFILYILYDKKILVSEDDNYMSNFIKITIISLIYLPFIPYIKSQLTKQLSLPKD